MVFQFFGSDVDFLSDAAITDDHQQRLRIWNTETLQELMSAIRSCTYYLAA